MLGDGVSRTSFDEIQAALEREGQGHVFRFWDDLGADQRASLLEQCAALDLPALRAALEATSQQAAAGPAKLEPVEVERIPEHGGDAARFAAARERGEQLLAEGRVGLMVVAGGQATRLGFPGPKGTFPIGPVSDRSLFEIQAQKIRRVRERSGAALPWYVMTSAATDAETRSFFAEHDFFGLPESDVRFFCQGMVPSFDFEGRLILAEPGRIAENPDGHGGSLTALHTSGVLDDAERRGITTLFYYQVDNPLIRMADPAFLGFHDQAGAEASCKVARKVDPAEKVGVLASVDGRLGVVEYTELDDASRQARDDAGELLFWAGNLAIHAFEVAFVRRIAADADRWLPFHASEKKIASVDATGAPLAPEAPNGRKLERFVFDALPAARAVALVETDRARDFSPVKNAEGSDSPETARRDLSAEVGRWLAEAGLEPPTGAALEIDHSRVDSAEDACALGLRDLAEAEPFLRMLPGAFA
ncbi:MAG: UTP--glucose-1-phosphate uridylyltransferase [Myxococcota bacterium]